MSSDPRRADEGTDVERAGKGISLGLILTCLPWLALLVWLASVSWFLTDDAFISFRYVHNLLEGHGLVFNPGERVEGYSNFLWVLELAAIWRVLGVALEDAAPWLSGLHRRNRRRDAVVDNAPALAAKPGLGRLRTGQYIPGQGQVWKGEIHLVE